jgi:hypothetical protein
MNRPWPEIMSLLVTVAQWEALRKKGPWATTGSLRIADVLDTTPTHGRHPWEADMKR